MAYTKLGRIRPVYSGEWNSGRAYTALEMVRTPDGGLSYIAQKDVPAGTPLTNGEYWAVVLDVREVLEAAKNASDRVDAVMDVKANALSATAAGNPVQFSPDEHSIIKPVLTLLPVQPGSGEPSPDNIRPITGWTGAVLTRCGKNLLGGFSGKTQAGITFTVNDDGSVHVSGTSTAQASVSVNVSLPKGRYVLSGCPVGGTSDDTSGGYALYTKIGNNYRWDTGSGVTFGLDMSAALDFSIVIRANTTIDKTFYPQIEFGSTASAFESYRDDTYTLDFGQTVYGCKVDVNKGELVIDRGLLALTGNEGWAAGSTNANSYYINGASDYALMDNVYVGSFFDEYFHACSHYKADVYKNLMSNATCEIYGGSGGATLMFKDDNITSLAAWKSYLAAQHAAGTPVQVAYRLAAPSATISLTPQQITALAGVNTVYGDADEITVHYNKSLNAAFEELKNAILAMGGNV